MRIEFQFNSVRLDPQDLQEYCPNIISTIGSNPVVQKTPKRRRRKKRKTVAALIEEIIDSIEENQVSSE